MRRKERVRTTRPRMTSEAWAVAIFILMVIVAPLAFGAVDRIVQIGLLLLLGLGICFCPPAIARTSRIGNALIVAGVAILLLKEFGPATVFGTTQWRSILSESYGVVFPWTHNPEPSRALDGMLAGVVAGVWFLWARTLAIDRTRRIAMVWGMLASAAIVSIVSFATRGIDPEAIYGWRFTPGWVGFGPFPNRNHTASFLAMGVLLGAGCVAWAGMRKYYRLLACALVLSVVAFAGLLATQSRGGLVVLTGGFVLFMIFVLIRFPNGRSIAIAVGAFLTMGAIGLAFGAQAISRFTSKEGGEVSTLMRVRIWQDTLGVIKDAPVFGHGIGSFTQIFPMYQEVATGEAIVLHPESSLLQWLVEFGALPVVVGGIILLAYVAPRIRAAYAANRSIFLRAGPFAAVAALGFHTIVDVPAHRWGTAGFGLAALALACAPGTFSGLLPATRRAALVPVGIAVFWTLPFLWDVPTWSPLSFARLLTREQTTPFVSVHELERSLRYFPLNPTLHYSIAMHQIDDPLGRRTAEWQQHFRVAARLMPGSWELAALQARGCARVSPGISLHYWQVAVERAGHRAEEVFGIGIQETVRLRGAAEAWEQYARLHPELLLTYSRHVPEAASRDTFELWWRERGLKAADISEAEFNAFYSLVAQRGTREQFEQFAARHPERRARDFRRWVEILNKWEAYEPAWAILATEWPEPVDRTGATNGDPARLSVMWDADPTNVVNAHDLAEHLARIGEIEHAQEIILKVAARPNAPAWFLRKAARVHASRGDVRGAVALFLRETAAPR